MSRRGISQRDITAMSHQQSLGPSASMGSQPQSSIEKIIDEAAANKAQLNTVSCMYQTHIAGYWRNLTILWCKNIFSHTLNLVVNSLEGEFCYSCKIEIKPWPFWNGKKGSKTFQVEGCQVDLYWDLRSARYSGSAEPSSDYYVAMVSDEEITLLIGDYKKKAYKRTKARPALVDSILYSKKENVFAKKSFSTRARFDERKQENEIVVESSMTGPKDPEMWISIDGIIMIHVKNLQWKFRGNQTVTVNKQPVQVFWDVHDWLFTSPGTGHGLFIFKPGPAEFDDVDDSPRGTSSDTSDRSMYFSTKSIRATPEFCLILYAWKVE